MKKIIVKVFVILSLVVSARSVKAQSSFQPNVNTPSPNASSLGQYGEVPVSLFAGVPNISIPIYTVSEGDYKLPIGLSYHYSGVRPNVCPGSNGTNWTLLAGGAITRVIKGFPDEGSAGKNLILQNYGYLYNSTLPTADGMIAIWNSPSAFVNYLGANITPPTNVAGSVLFDLTPDEFDFNFCGISGSFYLDAAGVMRVKCDHDVKVSYNPTLITPYLITYLNIGHYGGGEPGTAINTTFGSFTITDEDGTKYTFGEQNLASNNITTEAIEYSSSWLSNSFHATSWYLTTITLPNNKQIKFNYDRGPFTTQLDKTFRTVTGGNDANCPPLIPGDIGTIPPTQIPGTTGLTYSTAILAPIYLTSISTSSGTHVSLNYSKSNAQYYSEAQYLNVLSSLSSSTQLSFQYPLSGENTTINEKQNYLFWSECYKLLFPTSAQFCDFGVPYYQNSQVQTTLNTIPTTAQHTANPGNYFTRWFNWMKLTGISVVDNFNNVNIKNFNFVYDETARLKLTQIQNLDNQNNVINKYQFTYNTTPISLPGLLTDQTDYWGYFNDNGQTYTTQNFVPQQFINNKAVNLVPQSLAAESAELLKTITYPTGGTTTLQPENHYYSKTMDVTNPHNEITSSNYAGGVRIKRIINKDNLGNILTQKTYYYLKGYQAGVDTTTLVPSGELSGIPKYQYNGNLLAQNGTTVIPFGEFCTEPIIPASQNSMGSYIGYSEVAEVASDGSYSIYKYTNYSDGTAYQDALPNISLNTSNPPAPYPFPNNDNSVSRGKLKSVQNFQNNNHQVAAHIYDLFQNIYTNPASNTSVYSITGGEIMSSCSNYVIMGVANTIDLSSYVPTRQTDILYNPDNSYVQNITQTNYNNNYKKVNTKSFTASDGTNVITNYTYPFVYSDPISAGMVNNNIVAPVITEDIQKGATHVKLTKNVYQQWSSDANPGSNIFQPSSTQLQIGTNPIETRQNYLAYDPWGNLLCEAKPGAANTSFQWGYNNQYPVAKVENTTNTLNSLTTSSSGNSGASVTLPLTGGFSQYTTPFTVTGTGISTLNLGFSGNPNTPSNPIAVVNCTVSGTLTGGGSFTSSNLQLCICAGTATCSGGVNIRTINLAPGQYTLTATYSFQPTLSCNVFVQITYPYSTTTTTTTGIKEFFYEGFEENSSTGVIAGRSHTGNKYYSGSSYTVNWVAPNPATRSYVISYWYLNSSGVWTYKAEVSYTTTPPMVLSVAGATGYDDIRIYPIDALMTTYTYNPLIGLTSSTDPKGQTTYYEYDSFQRLMNVKDKDGNIIKHIDYHYQGQ